MTSRRRFINDDFKISYEATENSWQMPYSHSHQDYEIYLLVKGERIVTIDGTDYLTRAGDAALFSPNCPHTSRGDGAFAGICIHFSERYLDKYYRPEARRQLLECFRHRILTPDEKGRETLFRIVQDSEEAVSNNEDAPERFLALAAILAVMNRAMSPQHDPFPSKAKSIWKYQQILNYVSGHYTEIPH